jgi:polyhydroxybutyrate depolymerase
MAKNVHLILFLFLILLARTGLAADFSHNIDVQKTSRSFVVHIPDSLKGQKGLPVVIVMHGGGGNAEGMRHQTGMDGIADKNGFIAVYPEGNSGLLMARMRTWNAGVCCGAAARKKTDDVAFISEMIDFLVSEYAADGARIYATGHSNGSQMSYRLACELSDKVAAVATNAGQRALETCKPKRPVAVLHLHGVEDPCALYNGGDKCGGCYTAVLGLDLKGDKWPCRSVRDVVREHALMNGCNDITNIVFTKGAVTCEAFEGCPKEAPVELCSIEGAGHMWAGTHDRGPAVCTAKPEKKICKTYRNAVGPQNTDIDASQFIWDFFKDIRLPGKKP